MSDEPRLKASSPDVARLAESKEFYDLYRNSMGRRILYELQLHDPITVEDSVDAATLKHIFEHIQGVWSKFGEEDPHWSVVSVEKFRAGRIEDTINEFNESGRLESVNLQRLIARLGLKIKAEGTALEYGCGVGRVTRWLAGMFANAIGADVSASHLRHAQEYLSAQGVTNARFHHVATVADIANMPEYDFLYSKIVLQHNPPPIIRHIFRILCEKLRPGGAAVVQVPTYCRNYKFVAADYLEEINAGRKIMEMHVLPQPVIFDIFAETGCQAVEVSRDHLVTTVDFVSSTFVFKKP